MALAPGPRATGNYAGPPSLRRGAPALGTHRNTQARPCVGRGAWAGRPIGGHSDPATRVGGPGGLVAGWLAHVHSWPRGQIPLQALSFPPTTPSPRPPWKAPLPSVLSNVPCVTDQVSDQALLFFPRTIQGAARPHRLDSCAARSHCPGLPRR